MLELGAQVTGETWTQAHALTDPKERQRLRHEIDALVAHLYGLSRLEFAHILDTFPLVFPDDEAGQRKKDALLEIYDEMGA